MGSCTYLIPATWVTAGAIMAGLWVLTSTVLLLSLGGPQQRLGEEFGGTAVWPVTALTCLLSRATRLTPAVTGWVAKRSFACKPGLPLQVCLLITGHLPTGSHWIIATLIWAASARRWSM